MKIIAIQHGDDLWSKVSEYASTCSWRAGKNLSQMMNDNAFSDYERVFVALEKDNIAGYCTLLKSDCIPDVEYTPYIGFVFVDEDYRGNRISERLCHFAVQYAGSVGFDKVYLVSIEANLYEKYGFVKIDEKLSSWGAMQGILQSTPTSHKPKRQQ